MITLLTRSPRKAADYIKRGELVAFPTETVYGLGADLFNARALAGIFRAKGRPVDNPLIVHIATLEQISVVARRVPPSAQKLIDTFFPGPLTIILPKREEISSVVTAGLQTIGVRMPRDPFAQEFLHACGVPVAAPSANRSGRPSPTTWQAVKNDLDGRISCILRGSRMTEVGLESTVVDCTGSRPVILRAGAITLEDLRRVIPSTRLISDSIDGDIDRRSPGTRHRHYAPHARVELVDNEREAIVRAEEFYGIENAAFIGMPEESDKVRTKRRSTTPKFKLRLLCNDITAYARSLFNFFRRCDEEKIRLICCQRVATTGLGLALMDRLTRAAR
ncbi:MAG: L-threonylcarbamoyladenylate synthase [Pyrinomonadaceae bacterium]